MNCQESPWFSLKSMINLASSTVYGFLWPPFWNLVTGGRAITIVRMNRARRKWGYPFQEISGYLHPSCRQISSKIRFRNETENLGHDDDDVWKSSKSKGEETNELLLVVILAYICSALSMAFPGEVAGQMRGGQLKFRGTHVDHASANERNAIVTAHWSLSMMLRHTPKNQSYLYLRAYMNA